MVRTAVILLAATVLLAGCSGGSAPRGCDDGGDGGVMIDGVCL